MSETNKHNVYSIYEAPSVRKAESGSPAAHNRKVPGGTLIRWATGLSIPALMVGISVAEGKPEEDKPARHEQTDVRPVIYADHDTKRVKVRSGEGVDDVIQRVYGIDAPEGTNQVVQNDPAYPAEYQAILDQNGGSEELRQGQWLEIPKEFYTQEEVNQMQVNQ